MRASNVLYIRFVFPGSRCYWMLYLSNTGTWVEMQNYDKVYRLFILLSFPRLSSDVTSI